MSLLSGSYFLLLTVVLLVLRVIPPARRPGVLLAAGLIFYSSAGLTGFGLLLALTVANFAVYRGLLGAAGGVRGAVLMWGGIALNVSFLVGFKYLRQFAAFLGPDPLPPWAASWVAPLGVSFLTIQLTGAIVDAAQRTGEEIKSFGEFVRFVFFFPQMTIGPVARTATLVPELRLMALPDGRDLAEGVAQILQGAFKKLVVADRIGLYVNAVYQPEGLHYGTVPVLLAMLLYPLQIYADFSGYSDIAIGSARLIGVRLPPNFDRPFAAASVTEFWRRWHISFSMCLRDYLYMPLFIRLRNWGKAGMVISLVVTFVVCGFWHGASATFGLFGLLHGVALSSEALLKPQRKALAARLPRWLFHGMGVCYLYLFYTTSMVFFRSESVAAGWSFLRRAVACEWPQSMSEIFVYQGPALFAFTLAAAALLFACERSSGELVPARRPWAVAFMFAALLLLLGKGVGGTFIYAQF